MRLRLANASWYALAFILPCCVYVGSLFFSNLYPFGDQTISAFDLQITYTYFYEWLRNVLQGDANLFYSFSKSLGGNMYAGCAGILGSPLNLLLIFFTGDNILDFITFIVIVKFGFAGLTSYMYLRKRFKIDKVFCLALSVCYALMLYMTTQAINPMWMDAVVLLPCVMYGVYLLIHKGKVITLFTSVLLTIICCWYTGYMVCLFTILFYCFESFLYAPQAERTRLRFLVRPGRFSIVFTLAVVASAVLLIPTAAGLLGGKGAVPGGLMDPGVRFYLPEVIRSLFFGVYERDNLPQLYCGTLALIGALWFFLNQKIGRREKIAAGVFVLLLIFSTWNAPLERIWLGFRDGNGFYCRFAFLASALLIFMAARALETISKESRKELMISAAIVIVVAILIQMSDNFPGRRFFYGTILLACFYPLTIFLISTSTKKLANIMSVLLVLLVCGEAMQSSQEVFRYRITSKEYPLTAPNSYKHQTEYYQEGYEQLDEIDSHDNTDVDAYRIAKTYSFISPYGPLASNESLVYGYSQLAIYDSAYDDRVQNFISYLGYAPDWSCVISYHDPILPSDSLLGVRFVSTDKKPFGFDDIGMTVKQDGYKFYENPYAMSLGYGADKRILGTYEASSNPFENQNAFVSSLLGKDVEVFELAESTQLKKDGHGWKAEVASEPFQYGYLASDEFISSIMTVGNEKPQLYLDNWVHGVFPIDEDENSETIELKLDVAREIDLEEVEKPELLVYKLNIAVLKDAINELSKHQFEIDVFEDGYVHGFYDSDGEEVLFTTIPYDAGWTVMVDGEEVAVDIAQETFVALNLEEGMHEIEMRYTLPLFYPCLIVTLLSLAVFSAYAWRLRSQSCAKR